jgi:hypothetical protein
MLGVMDPAFWRSWHANVRAGFMLQRTRLPIDAVLPHTLP